MESAFSFSIAWKVYLILAADAKCTCRHVRLARCFAGIKGAGNGKKKEKSRYFRAGSLQKK